MATATLSSRSHSYRFLHTLLVLLCYATFLFQTVQAVFFVIEPKGGERWTIGQQATILIRTTETQNFTVTLERPWRFGIEIAKVHVSVPNPLIAVEQSFQWLVYAPETRADYTIKITGIGSLLHPTASSEKFTIEAGPLPPPPVNTTTALPTSTAPPTPTATVPAGPTCEDIQQQCAAQARVFNPTTVSKPCSCGDPLPQPKIPFGTAAASVPLPHKSSSGAVPALVILVMALVGMF